MKNVNVGIMGHVDSGKTTIARWLSEQASTAAYDKSPQSQSRGITLDLGFSSLLVSKAESRMTFVDCPGHAALFKNVIGAAAVIDAVLLVVDGTKGIQTQTAECIVLASIVSQYLIVAVNKADLVTTDNDQLVVKLRKQLSSVLPKFKYSQFVIVSAKTNRNKEGLIDCLAEVCKLTPPRDTSKPFLMAIDHCFTVKGQGDVLTGTILQGQCAVNEPLILPELSTPVKIKSMQSFRTPLETAIAGDRVGCCVDHLPVKVERSVAIKANTMKSMSKCFLMTVNKLSFFTAPVRSKQRLHISVLHDTVLCRQIIFCRHNDDGEYEWLEELPWEEDENADRIFAVVQLDEAVMVPVGFLVIGSKMDINIESKSCRLCLYGRVIDNNVDINVFRLYKWKERRGVIDRVVDGTRAIGRGLVDREGGVINKFLGWRVDFVNDHTTAIIQSPFGTTGKFNLQCKSPRSANDAMVMRFKRYVMQPGKPMRQ